MFLLTQAPNGALSTRRCTISSPPQFPNPNPPLFSKTKPKFLTTNPPRRTPKLTVSVSDSRTDSNPATKPTISTPPPFNNDETVFVGEESVPLEGVIQFDKPNYSAQLNKWGRVALLAGGDVLALLVFSAIGRFSHGLPVFDVDTLHTADPFVSGWFLSAYFLGGYADDGRGMNGLPKAVIAATKSWAAGIPLGFVIRAATSGRIPQAAFMAVTMGSTAVLLIGWRALLFTILPNDKSKKNDVYRRGNPFELFEGGGSHILYVVLMQVLSTHCSASFLPGVCDRLRELNRTCIVSPLDIRSSGASNAVICSCGECAISRF